MQTTLTISDRRRVLDALLKKKGINVRDTEAISPREEADYYPLSFAQQRLWFLDQLDPGAALYNLPVALRLGGQLDVSALSRSFDEVVRRHESLRTTFDSVDGQPRQIIGKPGLLPLPLINLAGLPVSDSETKLARFIGEEARQPFDLASGPLLRVKLLRLAADDHVLLVTMHHIASDGWSMGILVREVTRLYAAYAAGYEPQLPELPIQYADYATWQRDYLKGETLEKQLDYWRRQLAGAPQVLELASDRPRATVQSQRGASHQFVLDQQVLGALQELSRREGATLFMTLLAAF
jgi:hypothetical protein